MACRLGAAGASAGGAIAGGAIAGGAIAAPGPTAAGFATGAAPRKSMGAGPIGAGGPGGFDAHAPSPVVTDASRRARRMSEFAKKAPGQTSLETAPGMVSGS